MTILVVSGTGTGVGKTVVTAAIAAVAAHHGLRVAAVKPAQTGTQPGEPGDLDEVRRLAQITGLHELARFRAPLAPETAARVGGAAPLDLHRAAGAIAGISAARDLVLVEGAGGLAVRYDDRGNTIADLARELGAPVLVVAAAGLGTLNHTALTIEALTSRQLSCAGVVIGAWPPEPDLAARTNLTDLPRVTGMPLVGVLPAGAGMLAAGDFLPVARAALVPALGGTFDRAQFEERHGWQSGNAGLTREGVR